MFIVLITIEVHERDLQRALEIGSSEAYTAHRANGWQESYPDGVVVEYKIEYPFSDGTDADQQRMAIDRIHQLLEAAVIEFTHRANGVSTGSGFANSKFMIRPVGAIDNRGSFSIFAADRTEFEEQWSRAAGLIGVPSEIGPELEVVVFGPAEDDPDLQEPPFVRRNRLR